VRKREKEREREKESDREEVGGGANGVHTCMLWYDAQHCSQVSVVIRCRENTAYIVQSKPDPDLGFQVKVLTPF